MKRKLLLIASLVIIIGITKTFSQTTTTDFSKIKPLKGFVKRVAGDTLMYNCFHPIAKSSLLTRCNSGKMAIEWKTQEVPTDVIGEYVYFVWIASYSTFTGTGEKNYDLSINNVKALTFKTKKDSIWTTKSNDGVELSFKLVKIDLANDANGYMYLKVPVAKLKKGEPLLLKVVGENANVNDWYMTFMYDMRNKSVDILPLPLLANKNNKLCQIVYVGINYLGNDGKTTIVVNKDKVQKGKLKLGFNNFEFALPAVDKETEITVNVTIDGEAMAVVKKTIKPVKKRTIYLLPHAHNDIGYTDLQPNVLKKHVKNIYDALELIKKTANYPAEARFKWNVEVMWAVEEFLATATEEKKKEFIDNVRNGNIGLQATYLNMLTGLMRPEEFYKLTEFARSMKEKYDIEIKCAMESDVPGLTWNTIPTLAQSGVKYFSNGPNGNYEFGDRVGRSNPAWADRPFYWSSQSGKEKILFWMTGWGYGSFFNGITVNNPNRLDYLKSFCKYDEWLEKINYPYEIVHLRHTVNGDNGTTDPDLSDNVKTWNENYVSPKFVIATSDVLFDKFEKTYGSIIPTFSGEITPYWEDGAASTANELGVVRNTSEKLVQLEALYSLIEPKKYNANKFYTIWKNILLFDEHTWGAWNSTSEPDNKMAVDQWKIKQQFSIDAANQSAEMMKNIIPNAVATSFFDVINTNSWERTDMVIIPASKSSVGDVVKNENDSIVPSQRLTNGDLAFIADKVPALSSKRFNIEAGKSTYKGNLKIDNNTIANNDFQLTLNTKTGSIKSFKIKTPNTELVDNTKEMGLNDYLYVDGFDPKYVKSNGNTTIKIKENGPLVASLLIESEAPGCNKLQREIRLINGINRVDIINTIDKKAIRSKESVHFAYPFNVPSGQVRMDLGYGVISPEYNQLAGSCKDYYSVQRWADVSNQDYGITWTVNEAPLVEVGELHSELPTSNNLNWKTVQNYSTTLYSYVMNNYWYTNYKADQGGVSTYNYSLYPHGIYNQAQVSKYGIERSQPLILQQVSKAHQKINAPFNVNSANVIVSYIKPVAKGDGYIVRLYNTSSVPEDFTVTLNKNLKSIYISNPFEEKGAKIDSIKLSGYEIITLIIE